MRTNSSFQLPGKPWWVISLRRKAWANSGVRTLGSASGLGGQGLVVARPGLEVSPTIAGRCSPDHCQGSDSASVLSAKNCGGDCCQWGFQHPHEIVMKVLLGTVFQMRWTSGLSSRALEQKILA